MISGGAYEKGALVSKWTLLGGSRGMLPGIILNIETATLALVAPFRLKFSILNTVVKHREGARIRLGRKVAGYVLPIPPASANK